MGSRDITCETYINVDGRYEKIGAIPEMQIEYRESNEAVKIKLVAVATAVSSLSTESMRAWEAFTKAVQATQEFGMRLRISPNNRIAWLAVNHKKKRVRKKNMKRMKKYFEGGSK